MYGIASRPASFADPLDLLAAAHARIDAQLDALEKLAEHVGAHGADRRARDDARSLIRYFDTSALHHHRDEDEDLFPLLRALAAERRRPEIAALVNDIEAEHATMDGQWSRLRERLQAIALAESARLDLEEVARFGWLYRRHMAAEGASLLPFANESLSQAQRASLAQSMAARRGKPHPP
jgi:hemerythrin-like domain-containing protein